MEDYRWQQAHRVESGQELSHLPGTHHRDPKALSIELLPSPRDLVQRLRYPSKSCSGARVGHLGHLLLVQHSKGQAHSLQVRAS